MRIVPMLTLLASFAAGAAGSNNKPDKNVNKADDEKSLYAMGYILGAHNLAPMGLSARELKIVEDGIADSVAGKKSKVDVETQMPKVDALAKDRANTVADREKAAGLDFAAKAAKEPGAVKVPVDGKGYFVYRTLTAGAGASPAASDTVNVDYEGKLTNGTVFDSSYSRGVPAEFGLKQVIPCWTLGVAKMKVGEKAQLTCPSDVAYGGDGSPPSIPGGATLVFTIELHSIKGHEVAAQRHKLVRSGGN